MEQAEADDHTRLRCSASKNAMQSHALQIFMAFYGTGNFEIVKDKSQTVMSHHVTPLAFSG